MAGDDDPAEVAGDARPERARRRRKGKAPRRGHRRADLPEAGASARRAARQRARRVELVLSTLLILVTLTIVWWRWGSWVLLARGPEVPRWGWCRIALDRATLDRSLELGRAFMIHNHTAAGNFNYEYDWKTQTFSKEDNEVRQAGALWGLTLIHLDAPDPELAAHIDRGLAFFAKHERLGDRGQRCVAYPGDPVGTTGTIALLALAHIDYLRALGDAAPRAQTAPLRARLDGYLSYLVAARNDAGVFHGSFDRGDCRPLGEHSPYSDGEALLALTKAARYTGRDDLSALAVEVADAGYRVNVEEALAQDRDSDTTKGFYQWSSMGFFELATSGWSDTERFGDHVMELADWMINVHHTLWRARNTAYAYEGIIHAYEMARRRNDPRQSNYACVIDAGLQKLTSWQVGGPNPAAYLWQTRDLNDPFAVGGVQNEPRAPGLRIDVTQHQMHAVILARRYVYR